jgi:uncharacterized protein with HEPN domain
LPSKRAIRRFNDIVYNIDAIRQHTAGMTCDQLFADQKTRDATLHCLLRISEAARKLGKTAEEIAPDCPGRNIRDLGNRLRHEYDVIERDRICFILDNELGTLRTAPKRAIERLRSRPQNQTQ